MSRRIESSEDKESLGDHEDASKQGRSIEDIDKDADVSLVDDTQGRSDDAEMFDINDLHGDEVNVDIPVDDNQEQSAKEREVDTSVEGSAAPTTINQLKNVSTATTIVSTATTTVVDTPAITTPPQQRAKGIAFRELVESTIIITVPSQKSKDKGKQIMIEPEKPLMKKIKWVLDEELAMCGLKLKNKRSGKNSKR
ncbi:hypothetical protein Tco_0552021 [Tanacetum coccineum]